MITNNITTSVGVKNSISSETWKPIVGYEGIYEVSSQGRVKNAKTERILKTWSSGLSGYTKVELSKGGKAKPFFVHRLVAEAFLPNPDKRKSQIDHINFVRTDNRVSNLEWVTPEENIRRMWAHKHENEKFSN